MSPTERERLRVLRATAHDDARVALAALGFTAHSGGDWRANLDCEAPGGRVMVAATVRIPEAFPDVPIEVFVDRASLPAPIEHVEPNGKLCLVPEHGALLDVTRVGALVRDYIARARDVLSSALMGRSRPDLMAEFLAYWDHGSSASGTVLSLIDSTALTVEGRELFLGQVRVRRGESEGRDRVLADSKAVLDRWARSVGGEVHRLLTPAFLLPLSLPIDPPLFGEKVELADWMARMKGAAPPAAWNSFSDWLQRVELPVVTVMNMPVPVSSVPTLAAFRIESASASERRRARELGGGRRPRAWDEIQVDTRRAIVKMPLSRRDAPFLTARGGAGSFGGQTVAVIGCGAVGSIIALQLAAMGVGKLVLVDPEDMGVENVHRHALGSMMIGSKKVVALRAVLERDYPHQQVEAYPEQFETVLAREEQSVASADVVVFAIGDETLQRRYEGIFASKRRVFGWVEPLGVGGHAMSVMPADKSGVGCYECLFVRDERGILGNAAAFAAQGQEFARTFAGCAGMHTPFSSLDAQRTATEASALICELMCNETAATTLVSWRGERDDFERAGFALSRRGEMSRRGTRLTVDGTDFRRLDCAVCQM